MLALVFAVEVFGPNTRVTFLKIDAWTWKQTSRRAERRDSKPGIVCLGDSLVQVGVASPILEKYAGRSTCNLAISGGSSRVEATSSPAAGARGRGPSRGLGSRRFSTALAGHTAGRGSIPGRIWPRGTKCSTWPGRGVTPSFLGRIGTRQALADGTSPAGDPGAVLAALGRRTDSDQHHMPPSLRRNLEVNPRPLLSHVVPARSEGPRRLVEDHFPADWACPQHGTPSTITHPGVLGWDPGHSGCCLPFSRPAAASVAERA